LHSPFSLPVGARAALGAQAVLELELSQTLVHSATEQAFDAGAGRDGAALTLPTTIPAAGNHFPRISGEMVL